MIVLSRSLVLSDTGALGADNPVIGYDSVVTAAGIVADSEDSDHPASNLANPATHLYWESASDGEQYLTITTNEVDPIDYVAIAGHNFGSANIPISIEGLSVDDASPLDADELVADVILPDDGPALFRFTPQSLTQVRIRLQRGDSDSSPGTFPKAAVVYAGRLLVLERKIYQGHTPISHGRRASILTGRSESGNFLGRVVLNETRESAVQTSLLSPDWYRTYLDPFIAASKESPFFFSWRPQSYPREVGFAWMMNDPRPVNEAPSGLISIDMQMQGIA